MITIAKISTSAHSRLWKLVTCVGRPANTITPSAMSQ